MINFIKKIWNWLRVDGLLHIETSALVVLATDAVAPWWVGNIVSATAGVAKEVYDRFNGGSAEWHDIICDVIGIVIADIIILIRHLCERG